MPLKRLLALFWDRAAAVICVLVAAVMLLAGWFSLSAEDDPGEQIPYIMSGGIGGLFLLCIAATLWLSADLRDEWHKLDAIDESLRELADSSVEIDTNSPAPTSENGPRREQHAPAQR